MGRVRHPRRGSLQFWPHAKSKKHTAKVRSWVPVKESRLLGFVGYKVGMTHVLLKEENAQSPRKGMKVFAPVTVIECPPMRAYSVRYYSFNDDGDLKLLSEVFAPKVEKELRRKIIPSKKQCKAPESYDLVRVTVYTQPKFAGIGKKKPDMVEMEVGGKDVKERAAFAESLLGKEIKIADVFKAPQAIDVHAVSKGKGFSGSNKKFHSIKSLQHKSEKGTRGIGTLGPWHPNKVRFSVAQAGKWGYLLRTEYNKVSLKIGTKPEEINPKGGFVRYGIVKSDYLLVKGSVPGAVKRPVTVTEAIRPKSKMFPQSIQYTSLESKQR